MKTNLESVDILALSAPELAAVMALEGAPAYRARQLFEGLWHHRIGNYDDLTVWPQSLRTLMQEKYPLRRVKAGLVQEGHDGNAENIGQTL